MDKRCKQHRKGPRCSNASNARTSGSTNQRRNTQSRAYASRLPNWSDPRVEGDHFGRHVDWSIHDVLVGCHRGHFSIALRSAHPTANRLNVQKNRCLPPDCQAKWACFWSRVRPTNVPPFSAIKPTAISFALIISTFLRFLHFGFRTSQRYAESRFRLALERTMVQHGIRLNQEFS